MINIGLRIDVDTFRGTRDGVPRLLEMLNQKGIKGTFFFSVGPDNMGRHLWRLLKPNFFIKMLRSNASSLYGFDILLAGTAWPGKHIGRHLASLMREADSEKHEIGLHAWDHHAWQVNTGRWQCTEYIENIQRGVDTLNAILARQIDCSAAPGWRSDECTIDAKQSFAFRYNSDCRGQGLFRPRINDHQLAVPQIPVNLPTFDEVIGTHATVENFNTFILEQFNCHTLNGPSVYTIHAEVEGIVMATQFSELLDRAHDNDIRFISLGDMLPPNLEQIPPGRIVRGYIEGREGWVGCKQIAPIISTL